MPAPRRREATPTPSPPVRLNPCSSAFVRVYTGAVAVLEWAGAVNGSRHRDLRPRAGLLRVDCPAEPDSTGTGPGCRVYQPDTWRGEAQPDRDERAGFAALFGGRL